MKLRNKLIPILGVATTAATIAPLASCGNISEYTDMIDVLHGYIPTVDRSKAYENLSQAQVEDLYVEHVKKNPEIFAQDLAWWESMALKYRLEELAYGTSSAGTGALPRFIPSSKNPTNEKSAKAIYTDNFEEELLDYNLIPSTTILSTPQVAKFGVSNLSINEVKLINPNTLEEEKIHTISMDFSYEFDYEQVADCNQFYYYLGEKVLTPIKATVNRVVKSSLKSSYKNIPFEVTYDSAYGWVVRPFGWEPANQWVMAKLSDWEFDFDLTSTCVDTITDYNHNTYAQSYDMSKSDKIKTVPELLAWCAFNSEDLEEQVKVSNGIKQITFGFGSYHLWDVVVGGWDTGYFGSYEALQYCYELDKSTSKYISYFKSVGDDKHGIYFNWSDKDTITGNYPVSAKLKNTVDLQLREYDSEGKGALIDKSKGYVTISPDNCCSGIYDFGYSATDPLCYIDLCAQVQKAAETVEDPILWPEDIITSGDVDEILKFGTTEFLSAYYQIYVPKGTAFKFEFTLYNGNTVEKTLTIDEDVNIVWSLSK